MKFNTLIFCLLFLIIANTTSYAQINQAIEKIANHPNLAAGRWSVYAKNTATGEIVADYQSNKIMYPASNLKLLTTAVALDMLGSDYRINTFIEYDGKINSNGVLTGNLYFRGEGDPTLGSCEMQGVIPYDSLFVVWANKLKEKGISKIAGNIIADDSYLDYMPLPRGWEWEDIGNYYAAGTSGLCINENLYYLFFKPGKKTGDIATVIRTEPHIQNLKFLNNMKTGKKGSGDKGYIYGAPWQTVHQLEGTVPAGVNEFSIKGALPDPAKFAAEYFEKICEKNRITVLGKALTVREYNNDSKKRIKLFVHTSPALKEIIFHLNKKSNNLYAEQLVKILGKKFNNDGSLESGLAVVKKWLKDNGIETKNLFLKDGSGLTRSNGVTTDFFVDLLQAMLNKSSFSAYFDSLPIAGDPDDLGGLNNFCVGTKAAKNLRAKTGSHNRIRAHSGYVYNRSGQLICFSMIANDYKGSSKTIDRLHQKIMIQLADLQ